MNPLNVTNYLLARLISLQSGEPVEQILKEAVSAIAKAEVENPNQVKTEQINEIYALYPTKCPVSGRLTGKSTKDKTKIAARIKELGFEEVKYRIKRYMKESEETDTFFKNFSTLLNNFPDYSDAETLFSSEESEWQ